MHESVEGYIMPLCYKVLGFRVLDLGLIYIDLRLSSCTVGYLICARKFSPAFLIKVAAS